MLANSKLFQRMATRGVHGAKRVQTVLKDRAEAEQAVLEMRDTLKEKMEERARERARARARPKQPTSFLGHFVNEIKKDVRGN